MKIYYLLFLASVAWSRAFAGAFTAGDLVVVQVGTGSGSLGSIATAAFLDEFSPVGSSVQSIALPTSASGANQIFTLTGNATSEGFLALSANGQYLTLGGYNSPIGTLFPLSGNGNRVVARIDLFGNVDTTTILGDNNLGNIRSVVSDNGANFWIGTSSNGVRYTTYGSTGNSTSISASLGNARVVKIFSSQLYTSSGSTPFTGVSSVGTGLPTASGQTTTLLAAGLSPYDYVFASANTLYVADDRNPATGGGLQKYTFDGTGWNLAYTLTSGLTTGLRGLTGVADGLGNEVLYATTTESSANRLVTITDVLSSTTGTGENFNTLDTASPNTAFRGVALVPEPRGLLGIGFLVLLIARKLRHRAEVRI